MLLLCYGVLASGFFSVSGTITESFTIVAESGIASDGDALLKGLFRSRCFCNITAKSDPAIITVVIKRFNFIIDICSYRYIKLCHSDVRCFECLSPLFSSRIVISNEVRDSLRNLAEASTCDALSVLVRCSLPALSSRTK